MILTIQCFSLPIYGQGTNLIVFVNVNYNGSSGTPIGTIDRPFLSLKDALDPSLSYSQGDKIFIAPGLYSDNSSTGGLENFPTGGYRIGRGVSLNFWDIDGDLPDIDPGVVEIETSTSGTMNAFFIDELGKTVQSGFFFYGAVIPSQIPNANQRLILRHFEEAAISVQLVNNPGSGVNEGLTIDGVAFEENAQALYLDQNIKPKRYEIKLSRSRVPLPSLSSGVSNSLQAVEVLSQDEAPLDFFAENVEIKPSDRNHNASAFTFFANGQLQDLAKGRSLNVELKNCNIMGYEQFGLLGAGIEVVAKPKGKIHLEVINSTIKDCVGEGIFCESRGLANETEEAKQAQVSLICRNTKIQENGGSNPSSPNLVDAPASTSLDFTGSGIFLYSKEHGMFPLVRLNGSRVDTNGHHGLSMNSLGQYEFHDSYPKVQCWGSSLSDNGWYVGSLGTPTKGHGIHGYTVNDAVSLELERCLIARNHTTGVTLLATGVGVTRNGKCTVTNCVLTQNMGLGLSPTDLEADRAPFRFIGNFNYEGIFQFSHSTISGNPLANYSIAISDAGGSGLLSLWQSTSGVENCVLRENGESSSTQHDMSFFPEAITPFWDEVFATTYHSNLNWLGDPQGNKYQVPGRNNFFSDPMLVQYSMQTVNGLFDFGKTFPSTPLQGGTSPLIERGQVPQSPAMEQNKDIRSYYRPVDRSDIPNFSGIVAFDVGAFEVQDGE